MGNEQPLDRMITALATKDRRALETVFTEQATMRALLPRAASRRLPVRRRSHR